MKLPFIWKEIHLDYENWKIQPDYIISKERITLLFSENVFKYFKLKQLVTKTQNSKALLGQNKPNTSSYFPSQQKEMWENKYLNAILNLFFFCGCKQYNLDRLWF